MKDLLKQHANNPTKLLVNLEQWSDPEVPEQTYVVFKGSPSSLRFLGKLLTTFADEDHGSTFFMHPLGQGKPTLN
jgi:hypothetical protein